MTDTEPILLTVEQAHAAIDRCKFVVPDDPTDPDQTDAGREIVHCFLSFLGADWDAADAKHLCEIAEQIVFADTGLFGVCLCVVSKDQFGMDDALRVYRFNTVTPA